MKASFLWTINDFFARSYLSGWARQGYYACLKCNKDTPMTRVRGGGKSLMFGYTRFLRVRHPSRKKKKEFNGQNEEGHHPKSFTNAQIMDHICKVFELKSRKHPSINEDDDEHGETLCGSCWESYASDEFWIYYDICERWFHGKCVKITPAKAEHIKQYKYPTCRLQQQKSPSLMF
ncbi:PHD finger protein ALFIN-LIKE 1-like protein [Tanacetum coccineum]